MVLNVYLFLISIGLLLFTIIVYIYLRKYYKSSLIDIEIKERGFLYFYQFHLGLLFNGYQKYSKKHLIHLTWLHYVILHFVSPIFLSSFLLKHDWNVLIAIISIVISMNLYQKVYPANLYSSEDSEIP